MIFQFLGGPGPRSTEYLLFLVVYPLCEVMDGLIFLLTVGGGGRCSYWAHFAADGTEVPGYPVASTPQWLVLFRTLSHHICHYLRAEFGTPGTPAGRKPSAGVQMRLAIAWRKWPSKWQRRLVSRVAVSCSFKAIDQTVTPF